MKLTSGDREFDPAEAVERLVQEISEQVAARLLAALRRQT